MDAAAMAELARLVEGVDTLYHVTHVNPDADGFGSALAMSRVLRARGKASWVLLPSPVPRRLAFLAGPDEVLVDPDPAGLDARAAFLVYDVSTLTRLGRLEATVRGAAGPRAVLDHHDGAIDFEGVRLVDPDAAATAQIAWDVLEAWRVPMSLDLALPLYVGLLADTGSFNYGKTSPHSHRVAARMLELGVDPLAVHGQLEGTRSLAALQVLGNVLASLVIDADEPRLAHATLPLEVWTRVGEDAIEGVSLVNQTIALEGVHAGVLFAHVAPTTTRMSFRSKGAISIVEVAKSIGGGGHRNAAGATVTGTPDSLREDVLARLRASLREQLGG